MATTWAAGNNDGTLPAPVKGFYTPPATWKSRNSPSANTWKSEKKSSSSLLSKPDLFHVLNKIPSGDSPYVKAKHVQLIEKDPGRAVSLFWKAINSGDRVDSALKDMAVVMKQLDRSDEAIEAVKSFRHLCSSEAQEAIDNVLVELYKRTGRLEEQIEVLQLKLKRVEEGNVFAGKRMKLARSQGKKVHITVEQEYARLLGNLAWAYLQQNEYKIAEEYYRKALSIEPDRNKQCNLAICLMYMDKITEAKFLLQAIQASLPQGHQMDESYAKSFERASQLLDEIELQRVRSSSFEESKENHCENSLDFTPYKNHPCKSSTRNSAEGRVLSQVGSWHDFSVRNTVGNSVNTVGVDSGCNRKTAYTTPVQARGLPTSPFTQPRRGSREVIHSHRRLEFEKAQDSDSKRNYWENHHNGSMKITDSDRQVKLATSRTSCSAYRDQNSSGALNNQDGCDSKRNYWQNHQNINGSMKITDCDRQVKLATPTIATKTSKTCSNADRDQNSSGGHSNQDWCDSKRNYWENHQNLNGNLKITDCDRQVKLATPTIATRTSKTPGTSDGVQNSSGVHNEKGSDSNRTYWENHQNGSMKITDSNSQVKLATPTIATRTSKTPSTANGVQNLSGVHNENGSDSNRTYWENHQNGSMKITDSNSQVKLATPTIATRTSKTPSTANGVQNSSGVHNENGSDSNRTNWENHQNGSMKISDSDSQVKLATSETNGQNSSVAHNNNEDDCDFPVYKGKKSWADMVEEDEQEMMKNMAYTSYESFVNENLNLNMIPIENKFQSFSLIEDDEDGSIKHSSARRSLIFNQQSQKEDSQNSKSRTRLKVFQDLSTLQPETQTPRS